MKLDWLGEGFQTEREEGLYARLDGRGEVIAFGYKGARKHLHVDVQARTSTETTCQEFDEEVEFEEWLSDQREGIRLAAQPFTARLRCSFCGKSNTEVKKLIAGPTTYICNECVELCSEILAEEDATGPEP